MIYPLSKGGFCYEKTVNDYSSVHYLIVSCRLSVYNGEKTL